jgi:hypothetical protein
VTPSESYLKVAYDIRPAKQIERRMLIDGLQRLGLAGFQIADYQYTGFGSVYFVDFILFYKLLGITRLLNVEYSNKIKKRIRFNRPYKQIDLAFKPIADVIPTLSPDLHHLLWLDYDNVLNASQLIDINLAGTYLSVGSLLLITVDVEPPGLPTDGPQQWFDYFRGEAEQYLGEFNSVSEFAESRLTQINVQILSRAIKAGLAGRGVSFVPVFNFLYADGHKMLTMGGIIASDNERRQIQASTLFKTVYARRDFNKPPYEIRVPRLTRKERIHLDCAMPSSKAWRPSEFELRDEDVLAYREIHRFFPAYAELLL